jgi:molecular chaperone GrpE
MDSVTDKPHTDSPDTTVRVVDRRWWAREAADGPPDDGGARKPTYVEDLERQVAEQAAQLTAFSADHRRAIDEFEGVKARIRRDVGREVERGRRAVLVELLEVLDNLDRAIAATPRGESIEAVERVVKGVELVRDQFLSKLSGFGVARLAAVGEPFDAAHHEAVTTTPVDDAAQDGVVVAVVKEGYTIGGEVLRPASVVVGQARRGA